MAITKLTVENFKSFDKLEVELRPFNIIVGSNASGKSNFLDVFRFIRDISDSSLENAIGVRGGGETLRNFNHNDNRSLRICVETDDVQRRLVGFKEGSAIGERTDRTTYEIAIQFNDTNTGFNVVTDRLIQQVVMFELDSSGGPDGLKRHRWRLPLDPQFPLREGWYSEMRSIGHGRILQTNEGGLAEISVEFPEGNPATDHDLRHLYGSSKIRFGDSQNMMLEEISNVVPSLRNISTYDFDPRKAQLAVPPSGSRELDADAENLSVVLREILRSPESKKRLINLVSVLLPFVRDLDVEEFGFGQLMTTLTERFSDKGHQLPAYFASDGTVACLALVVALYFQESAVTVFEEPDRHIHPHLASQVMQMMNEVTERTQVIITTHNAELLRHANLEDILLVTRDSDGNSQVTRPADSEVLGHFLQNELGVEDLFVQNLLAL